MKRRLNLIVLLVLVLGLVGCQEQFQDLDTNFYGDPGELRTEFPVLVTNPDSLTIYRNADGFPNVAIICINGVPFSATSSNHQGGLRQVLDIEGGVQVSVLCTDAPQVTEGMENIEDPGGEG